MMVKFILQPGDKHSTGLKANDMCSTAQHGATKDSTDTCPLRSTVYGLLTPQYTIVFQFKPLQLFVLCPRTN